MFNKNESIIKKRSLFWQISTILITQLILGGIIGSIILYPVQFVFNFFNITDLFNFTLLKIIFYYIAIVSGLSLGIISVIVRSEIDFSKIHKIFIWLTLVNFFWILINLKSDDIFYGIINMVIILPFVYFYSKYLFNQTARIRNSFLKKFEFTLIIFYFVMYCLIFGVFFYHVNSYRKIGHNYFIENVAPKNIKSELDIIIKKDKQKEIEIQDNIKISTGNQIESQLNIFYQINNRYPHNLDFVNIFDLSKIFNDDRANNITTAKIEDFSYQILNNGQNYKLCIDLSTGEKCWP